RRDNLPIVWPERTHAEFDLFASQKTKKQPWKTAAQCLHLNYECLSIFKSKQPVAPGTLERIERRILQYNVHKSTPYIVDNVAPILTESANGSSRRSMRINEPLRTITAETKGGTHALYVCHLSKMKKGCTGQELSEPFHTLTTVNQFAEVRALLLKFTGQFNFK